MRENTSSYNHVLKHTTLFGGVQVMTILANIVRNKVIALFLGAMGMGLNSMFYSVQTFAAQCTNLGLSFGAVPHLSENYEHGDEKQIRYSIQVIRLWSMIAAVLGFLFCLVLSPLLGKYTFTWGHFYRHYAVLGFSVAALAIMGGEMAILKATRRLKQLFRIQLYSALGSIIISVPLYYFLYLSGVLLAIILMAFFATVVTVIYSYRCYPFRKDFSYSMLHDGMDMLRVGLAFVLAAIIGSGSEMLIRSYMNVEGGLSYVGLFNAAYVIVITYAGVVFTGLEVDYFPRLSAVSKDIVKTNEMVNKQMEVSLLLLSPMLVTLLTVMPILVPLLFSKEFLPVVSMAQVAALAMYFKVLSMPIAYVTLARSYSLSYLLLETSYFVILVAAIVVGFRAWGIWGTGLAIVIAHVAELMIVGGYAYWQYHYRCTSAIVCYAMIQMLIGFAAYAVTCLTDGFLYWIIEAALILISTAYSIHILHQKTSLWEALTRRFKGR